MISAAAQSVLGYFVSPTEDAPAHIDAEFFAEEVIELLNVGYLRLEGTLQHATLHVTFDGVEAYANAKGVAS